MAEEPFLVSDLKANGGKLTFKTLDDLSKWIEVESQQWAWCQSVMNQDQQLYPLLSNTQFAGLNTLRKLVAQNQSSSSIKSHFQSYYEQSKATPSTSPLAKAVLKKKETSERAAAWMLGASLASPEMTYSSNSTFAHDGITSAILYRLGIKGSSEAEKIALDELFSRMAGENDKFREEREDFIGEVNRLVQENSEVFAEQEVAHRATIQSAREAFDSEIADSKARLAALEKTYDEKLSLQAPVLYWDNKRKGHRTFCIVLGCLAVVLMTLSVWLISAEIAKLLPVIQPGSFPEPWKLGVIIVSVTMLIWLNRIVVKMFLSQLHLFTDAHERSVLITTYLSLLRSDEALKDQDRTLILQILFRPAATGIVDDSGPAAGMEIFSKLVSGK